MRNLGGIYDSPFLFAIFSSDKLPYTQDDFPFEIPESWVWVRLEDVCEAISDIDHKMPREFNGKDGIPYISPKDFLGDEGIDFDKSKKISHDDYLELSKKFEPKMGDIIFPRYGTIGKIRVIEKDIKLLVSYSCACIRIMQPTILAYVKAYLLSSLTKSEINKYINKTTQPNVGLKSIQQFIFPLPPLNEQKRIVAKLEEILPFIDEYDKKEQKLTALHQQFPEQLKKSILQSAIQGKLVEQDPNDEPASELVKRIQAEKERLISEKKIKKPKVKSEIVVRDNLPFEIVNGVERCIADEVPFEIPESWVWVRFENFVNFKLGKTPARSEDKYWNNPKHHWVSISDMNDGGIINNTKEKVSELAKIECFSDLSPKNTLLMSFKLSIGKVSITNIEAFHNEAIISIFPYVNTNYISRNYLFHILNEMTYYIPKTTAIKGNTLNSALLSSMLIPLPPLNEQKRIVEKIEELFSCIEYL